MVLALRLSPSFERSIDVSQCLFGSTRILSSKQAALFAAAKDAPEPESQDIGCPGRQMACLYMVEPDR
jgi:hypothetical protein